MPSATTWTGSEGIMLSEVTQAEKRQLQNDFTSLSTLKNKIKQKETHKYRELVVLRREESGWWEGKIGEGD